METDYSKLTKSAFEEVVRKYAVFRLLGDDIEEVLEHDDDESQ